MSYLPSGLAGRGADTAASYSLDKLRPAQSPRPHDGPSTAPPRFSSSSPFLPLASHYRLKLLAASSTDLLRSFNSGKLFAPLLLIPGYCHSLSKREISKDGSRAAQLSGYSLRFRPISLALPRTFFHSRPLRLPRSSFHLPPNNATSLGKAGC
jgi:hypothetical protein